MCDTVQLWGLKTTVKDKVSTFGLTWRMHWRQLPDIPGSEEVGLTELVPADFVDLKAGICVDWGLGRSKDLVVLVFSVSVVIPFWGLVGVFSWGLFVVIFVGLVSVVFRSSLVEVFGGLVVTVFGGLVVTVFGGLVVTIFGGLVVTIFGGLAVLGFPATKN